jgi:hypothetical protein
MKTTAKIAAVLLTFLFVTVLTAQDSSNGDTPKWIVTKISEEAGTTRSLPSSDYMKESYRDVSMNDCRLGYTVVLYNSLTKSTVTDKVSVPLDKNTSVSVIHDFVKDAIDDYAIQISTASKTIVIDRTRETDGRIESEDVSSIDRTNIIFGKPNAERGDTVSRVQKGLAHAIQVCSESTRKM